MTLHVVELWQSSALHGVHSLHRSLGDQAVEDASRRIHGHDYVIEVSVLGPVMPNTGMVVDQAVLRRSLEEALAPLRGVPMNEVLDGPATSENIAVFVWERLFETVRGLSSVTVARPSSGDRVVYRGMSL